MSDEREQEPPARARSDGDAAARTARRLKSIELVTLVGILLGFVIAYIAGDDPRFGIAVMVLGVMVWGYVRWRKRASKSR